MAFLWSLDLGRLELRTLDRGLWRPVYNRNNSNNHFFNFFNHPRHFNNCNDCNDFNDFKYFSSPSTLYRAETSREGASTRQLVANVQAAVRI